MGTSGRGAGTEVGAGKTQPECNAACEADSTCVYVEFRTSDGYCYLWAEGSSPATGGTGGANYASTSCVKATCSEGALPPLDHKEHEDIYAS